MTSLRRTTLKPMHISLSIASSALVRACNWLIGGVQFTGTNPEQDYAVCPLRVGGPGI